MTGLLLAVSQVPAKDGIETDAAFKAMSRIVGHWKGSIGKLVVEQNFQTSEGGKMIVGHGHVEDVLDMESRFGWDAAAKQPYYLDMHGHDTVYYGHIRLEGDEIVTDFNGLVGDKGHYEAHAKFITPDEYESTLYSVKDGKKTKMMETIKLKRVP